MTAHHSISAAQSQPAMQSEAAAQPIRLAIITGSTRPGRRGAMVADWICALARDHLMLTGSDVQIEVLDIADAQLPLLDEPVPAAIGEYHHEHTKRWSAAIAGFDGFIFITPEYNHSVPASLKNAIDYLFTEWNDKAAGFVSYGMTGGTRAVEHLRQALSELKVAHVRSQVALGLFTDFKIDDIREPGVLAPADFHHQIATRMIDELVDWSRALRPLRSNVSA